MTELLYQTDSYCKEFEASLVEVVDLGEGQTGLILDRTAFFPGGGGQPHDLGTLSVGSQRLEVQKMGWRDGRLLHFVPQAPIDPGVPVRGELDWGRRYQLMRTHTALHILCGVVWRDWRAAVTGGQMQPLRGRLDFEFESLTRDLVEEIEEKINREIEAAREIRVQILPREEAETIPDLIRTKINLLPKSLEKIRTVDIVGLDLQADGGTHVANTREVGRLKIVKYKSKGRVNKRLTIEVLAG